MNFINITDDKIKDFLLMSGFNHMSKEKTKSGYIYTYAYNDTIIKLLNRNYDTNSYVLTDRLSF